MGMLAAAAIMVATPALADCGRVNAAGSVGYVNLREWPSLYAPVIVKWNNPSHGSDWGSGRWLCDEYVDDDFRVWSLIAFTDKNTGEYFEGWASDKVLHFVD